MLRIQLLNFMTSGFHWVRLTIVACDPVFPHVPICGTEGVLFPLSDQKIKNKNAWSKVIWEWPSFDSECTKLWNISVGFSWPSPMSFLFTVISRQCYECLSLRSFEAKKTATPTEFRGIVCPKRVAKRKFTQHLVACTLIRMRQDLLIISRSTLQETWSHVWSELLLLWQLQWILRSCGEWNSSHCHRHCYLHDLIRI